VWQEAAYLAVAAGTIAHIGLRFRPFHRWDERTGAFHILAVDASPAAFIRELPRIYRGRAMRPGKAREAVVSRAVIRSASGPLDFMVDGDLYRTPPGDTADGIGEVQVAIGPRVKLIVAP